MQNHDQFKYYLYRNAWRFAGPPHEEQKLSKEAYRNLLSMGGLLVRNTYDFDCQEKTSFWYVIKDKYKGFDELSSRVRNKVRHAIQYFDYQLISYDMMYEKAFPIAEETFSDYSIHDRKMNRETFEQYLKQCKEKNFHYWGIFEKNTQQMVGFCTIEVWDNCCEYGLTGVFTKYKRSGYYPYYGLYQHLNQYYLEKLHYNYVSDSARTITDHSQIQDFLIQYFHFRKAYCQLAVHYKWWMKIAVNMLYPFRKIITLPRIKAILNMEAMQRGEK